MTDRIPSRIETALDTMDDRLSRSCNPDMKRRDFRVFRRDAAVYFVDGLVSTDFLQHYLLSPCVARTDSPLAGDPEEAFRNLAPVSEITRAETFADALKELMLGKAVLLMDGMCCALCFDIRCFVRRGISPPLTESVVNARIRASTRASVTT